MNTNYTINPKLDVYKQSKNTLGYRPKINVIKTNGPNTQNSRKETSMYTELY